MVFGKLKESKILRDRLNSKIMRAGSHLRDHLIQCLYILWLRKLRSRD